MQALAISVECSIQATLRNPIATEEMLARPLRESSSPYPVADVSSTILSLMDYALLRLPGDPHHVHEQLLVCVHTKGIGVLPVSEQTLP